LATSAAFPVNSASATNPATINGFRLRQKSCYIGDVEVLVCETGVKVMCRKGTIVTICPAPFNKIIIYSVPAKKIFSKETDKYRGYLANQLDLMINGGLADPTIGIEKKDPIRVTGIECDFYRSNRAYTQSQVAKFKQGLCNYESPKDYSLA